MTHISLYSIAIVDSQLYSTEGNTLTILVYVVVYSILGGNFFSILYRNIDQYKRS